MYKVAVPFILQGRVIALDKNPLKVEKIVKNLKKWGITCVESYAFDSTKTVDKNKGKYGSIDST